MIRHANILFTPGGILSKVARVLGSWNRVLMSEFNNPPRPLRAVGTPLMSFRDGMVLLQGQPYKLQFPAMGRTYAAMVDDNSIVGAIVAALVTLSRLVDIQIDSPNDSPEAEAEEEWLESVIDDMDVSFEHALTAIYSFYVHGYSLSEIIYKKRSGAGPYTRTPSKYNDGLYGISRLSTRPQITLSGLYFNQDETLDYVEQSTPDGAQVNIPGSRILYFRTQSYNGDPYGRSLLRSAYRDYLFVQRLGELAAIGVERNLVGLPVLYVPSELLNHNNDPQKLAMFNNYVDLVTRLRRDEQAGVLLPSDTDPETKQRYYSLELLKSPGQATSGVDVVEMIDRINLRITMSCLSDWLFLGNQRIGSFALSADKTSMFQAAIGAYVGTVAETLNNQLIPRLYAINGKPITENTPRFKAGAVSRAALDILGRFIESMSKAGMRTTGDTELENALRKIANLPTVDERGEARTVQEATAELATETAVATAAAKPKSVGGRQGGSD